MAAYIGSMHLTHNGHTSVTYLNYVVGSSHIFLAHWRHARVFKDMKSCSRYMGKCGFTVYREKPGYIKGSTVMYKPVQVDDSLIQWPISHVENEGNANREDRRRIERQIKEARCV